MLYDDVIADLLLDGGDEHEADATAAFLVDALGLAPGDRVFDQCAGTGRLSIPLARLGHPVIAVEQAETYVARGRARTGDLPIEWHVGDAFAFVPDLPCRGALNWWTSFGYLPDDDGNLVMLRRAFEALAPGGAFALDFLNMPGIYRAFRPREITRRGDVELVRDTTLDLARGLMHKSWRVGGRVRTSTVRAYHPHELVALAVRAGFVDSRLHGNTKGDALELDSPRCILIARRP